jgi:hypothetical protein
LELLPFYVIHRAMTDHSQDNMTGRTLSFTGYLCDFRVARRKRPGDYQVYIQKSESF